MKLQVTTNRQLEISEKEFEEVCQYVRNSSGVLQNSFLGTYQEPSIDHYIKALRNYLFTADGE